MFVCVFDQIFSNLNTIFKWHQQIPNNDADNATDMGIYPTTTSTVNSGDWGIILTFNNGNTSYNPWIFQFWLLTNGVAQKRRSINNGDWTEWTEI